ncbi:MAG TPA: PP2C family protein-serine/threonine phosphatase [Vicinamibacteria bacterium]|nr:PP2C family protein-serine/threonine phosphatase [Vicinamibacteria bacterium]
MDRRTATGMAMMDLQGLVQPGQGETPCREWTSTGGKALLVRMASGPRPAGREPRGTSVLKRQTREQDVRLRQELERAARIQRSLLPDVSRPVGQFGLTSLYWPCEALGGDFFDLARRPDRAVLLVSDVMGHGVEAALITMLVKAAFQEAAETTGAPGEVLRQMSARLRRMLPSGVFVAAAAARLGLEGSEIRLANAGLPHPFLLHANERRVEEVRLDGRPLGLLDGQGEDLHPVRGVRLEPGDVLLLSSDGIGCIRSAFGQCFEDCRLRQVLDEVAGQEGRNVIERLAAQAVDFGRGRPLPDDVNLVAVSRNGREAENRCSRVA